MQQSGPIASAYVAANGYVWAKYIFGKWPQCNRVGPLHMHKRLLIVTDAAGWAYCI